MCISNGLLHVFQGVDAMNSLKHSMKYLKPCEHISSMQFQIMLLRYEYKMVFYIRNFFEVSQSK